MKKERRGIVLCMRGDTLSKASDGCVTWSFLAPCAMCCDFNTGQAWTQLCALIG